MEGVYHQQQQQQQQQQQPIPSSGPANIPPIPTANSGMPVQPGLVPSNEVYDPNLVHVHSPILHTTCVAFLRLLLFNCSHYCRIVSTNEIVSIKFNDESTSHWIFY